MESEWLRTVNKWDSEVRFYQVCNEWQLVKENE